MSRRSAYLIASLGFGLLASALMALRIIWDGEHWHERTLWIVAISGFGGLVGAPMTLCIIDLFKSRLGNVTLHENRLRSVTARILAGLGFGIAWLGASAALFVFHNRVLAGQYEIHEERPILGFIFSSLQTLGLYTARNQGIPMRTATPAATGSPPRRSPHLLSSAAAARRTPRPSPAARVPI